ncbi:MAG: hypothetical protein WBP46_19960 [Thiolinea sp.]
MHKAHSCWKLRHIIACSLLYGTAGTAMAGSQYLAVWAGDQVIDQPGRAPDADFLAIIDADQFSLNYGKVVNTAVMASIPGEHLLAETENYVDNALNAATSGSYPSQNGDILAPNLSSAILNEAHHFNADHVVDPVNGHHYVYPGGLISANVFGCDVTDPLNVKPVPGTLIAPGVRYNPSVHTTIRNLCGLAVSARAVTAFSGTDDMFVLPNGNLIATYMGAKGSAFDPTNVSNVDALPTVSPTLPPTLTTPGGLVEFKRDGTVVGQYSAVPAEPVPGHGYYANGQAMLGPKRYARRPDIALGGVDSNGALVNPVTGLGADTASPDTGLLAHPHGIDFRADLRGRKIKGGVEQPVNGILMTSDYADPVSVALSGNMGMGLNRSLQDSGTTVRFWDMSNLKQGPYAVAQMPDGARIEAAAVHEEPEGLMAMAMTKRNKGAFVASMSGGALFYTADVTVANPQFKLVYDFGPSTGASVFRVTANDDYLILPLAGIQNKTHPTPTNPIADRDYYGEHTPRVLVLDIRSLIAAGTNFRCDGPPTSAFKNNGDYNRDGIPETFSALNGLPVTTGVNFGARPNNGSFDCPRITSSVTMGALDGHAENVTSHGGPHFVVENKYGNNVASSQYFVDLREFAVPGIGALMDAFNLPTANNAFYSKLPFWSSTNISRDALPGLGSIGDNTVCMMNRVGPFLARNYAFNLTDFKSPRGCIDMDFGTANKSWPSNGSRPSNAGNATPHSLTFIDMNTIYRDTRGTAACLPYTYCSTQTPYITGWF